MLVSQQNKRDMAVKFAFAFLMLGAILCCTYFLGAMARSGIAFERLTSIPKLLILTWKVFAELFLLAAAIFVSHSKSNKGLAIYVCVIVIAEIVLALEQVQIAGLIFILAHLIAMIVYSKCLKLPNSAIVTTISLIPIMAVLGLLTYLYSNNQFQVLALFPLFSAGAAFAAINSDYRWFLNGAGATILWMSDMLFVIAMIFTGDATSVGWLVWLTFSFGLTLIVLGLIIRQMHDSTIQATES